MNNLYEIHDEKFKSIYLSINFMIPVESHDIAGYAVLSSVFSKSCNKYINQKEIEKYLYTLYGANFDVNIELLGDIYNIEFRMEFVNKEFLPNKSDVLKDSLKFLNEIIFNPKQVFGKFDEILVKQEKEVIINKIRMRKDDKLKYAVSKTEYLLCQNEPFGASIYGFEEDVKKITNENLSKYYKNLLENACITVLFSGNLTGYKNLKNEINEVFDDKLNSNLNLNDLIIDKKNREKQEKLEEVYEKQDTNQSVITFGIKIKDVKPEDFYLLNVYNSILGATPSSKLFQNFREKESLAYTVRSRCYRFKGIIIIYAGIERKNYERAKTVIIQNLKEISDGKISDEEFIAAKTSLVSDLKESYDSKISLAKILIINKIVNNKDITIEEMIKGIEKVEKEDVVKFSNRIEIEKIFLLGGEDDA